MTSLKQEKALILAIPSKGRLQEQVREYFREAGISFKQSGSRGYRASLEGFPAVDVRLLSASEIASALAQGEVHLGVTGEDLIRETAKDQAITTVMPLGFGYADVVVAVPDAWIDVSSMADLDDVCAAFFQRHRRRLRIATKFLHLTRGYFAQAGITDYRIVESAGATEGAPAAGTAEAIVDITTTGATLAANNLKILDDGVILESQAHLAASLAVEWTAQARSVAEALLARLAARERAKAAHILRVRIAQKPDAVVALLAKQADTREISRSRAGDFSLLCPRAKLMQAIACLRAQGCGAVTVEDVQYVFEESNPIHDRFEQALTAGSKAKPAAAAKPAGKKVIGAKKGRS